MLDAIGVVYGYGDKGEVLDRFLQGNFTPDMFSDNYKLYRRGCFVSYLTQRIVEYKMAREIFYKSNIFYAIRTNIEVLSELVDWINSIRDSLQVRILGSEFAGKMYPFYSEMDSESGRGDLSYLPMYKRFYLDFAWPKKTGDRKKFDVIREYNFVPTTNAYLFLDAMVDAYRNKKGLDIHDILLEIEIKEEDDIKAKFLLELLTMVLLRMVETKEAFMENFIEGNVIDNIIATTNISMSGHALFDIECVYPDKRKLDVALLKAALDITNIKGALKENTFPQTWSGDMLYSSITQTPIILGVKRYLEKLNTRVKVKEKND